MTQAMAQDTHKSAANVLGEELQPCCTDPMTGFFRDGFCHTNQRDVGTHVVCASVTEEFLAYTKAQGNDLSTARPEFDFPGLKPGDGWCLCALRWREAYEEGVAPPVNLNATHEHALDYIPLDVLKTHGEKQ